MGNHLYDENRRLKAENERLRTQLNNRGYHEREEDDQAVTVIIRALRDFFTGDAFVIFENPYAQNTDDLRRIEFRPAPPKVQST